jgi:lipopolysaccharide biosynthesis protein
MHNLHSEVVIDFLYDSKFRLDVYVIYYLKRLRDFIDTLYILRLNT